MTTFVCEQNTLKLCIDFKLANFDNGPADYSLVIPLNYGREFDL